MTQSARILFLALLASLAIGLALAAYGPAVAVQPLRVSVTPQAAAFTTGTDAAFAIRVEGPGASLTNFEYVVEGGTISGVVPPNPIAANVAEGTVFVQRDDPGAARLTVLAAGEVLGTGEARFGAFGQVQVRTTLDAGPGAAARTWRYEVLDDSGQVVSIISLGTSGDAPVGSGSSAVLPHGRYTVRQVLSSDTSTSCVPGAFYEVAAPAGASIAVELDRPAATIEFRVTVCGDQPEPATADPADAPTDATPIDEVPGAREPGPAANPLPPNTGNTLVEATSTSSSIALLLLVTGAAVTSLPLFAWSAVRAGGRFKR